MRSRVLILAAVALTAGAIYTFARAQNPNTETSKNDEQAILKATQAYTDAFNKNDVDAMLAVWSKEADYIDETGKEFKGRDAIGEYLKSVMKEIKGVKMQIKTTSIRFVKDDIALQDGSTILTQKTNELESSNFSAVWLKKEGQWHLQLVRDLSNQPALAAESDEATHARLKDLAWMVGTWVTQEKDSKTTMVGKWMKGEKFLVLDYSIRSKDAEIMSLTQIIGWDPTGQRLHSWVFDSRGGFGEGYWTRNKNVWTVEVAGVTSDGRHGTGTHKFVDNGNETFSFEGIDRELDGVELPNVKVTYQRAAEPQ